MVGYEPEPSNSISPILSPSLLSLHQPFRKRPAPLEDHDMEEERTKRSKTISFNLESLSLDSPHPPPLQQIPRLYPIPPIPPYLAPSLHPLSSNISNSILPVTPPLQQGENHNMPTPPLRAPLHPSPDFRTTGLGISSPINSREMSNAIVEISMGSSYEISPNRVVVKSLDDDEEDDTLVIPTGRKIELHPRIFLEKRPLAIPYQIEIFCSPEDSQLVLFDPLVNGVRNKTKEEKARDQEREDGVKIEELEETDMEVESIREGIEEEEVKIHSNFVWPPVVVETVQDLVPVIDEDMQEVGMDLDD